MAHKKTAAAIFLTTTAIGLALSTAAYAAGSAPDAGIEEVLVTARKREENLQNIPDSVTAFTSKQIQERRLEKIDDFLAVTPNVHINNDQDTATNNISIRGLGSNRNQAAAVAFSVDGVVLPDGDAFTADLADLERVEVLKGPQGALYGKGAIAGAINITTKKPTNEIEGEAKVGYGTGNDVKVFGALSGPLIQDKLLGRVTVSHRDFDGTIENALTGKGMDRQKNSKFTGRLIFTPTDQLSFDLRGNYFKEKAGATWFSLVDVLGTTGGRITEQQATTRPSQDADNSTDRRIYDISLLADYETAFGTFTSISAYDNIKVGFTEDLDASPFPFVPFTSQQRNTKSFSQEVRLTSPSQQRFRYIIGGYFQHSTRTLATRASLDACNFSGTCYANGRFTSSGVVIPLQLAGTKITFDQFAAFAQINYDITEQLELTAALREDTNDADQNDTLASQKDKATFSKLQPKVSLAYKPTESYTLYATYSQGFKSGNFNPVSSGAAFPRVVGKEVSKNYEAGVKTALFDRRVILNAAGFYTEHLNPQIFQLDAATFTQGTLNAKKAAIKGFEFEMQARPIDHFDVNVGFGYIDTEIKDFDGRTQAYVGQMLPNAPKYTLNIGAQYTYPVTDDLNLRTRVDYTRTGKQSFQDFQLPASPNAYLYEDSFATVDGQIGLEYDRWTLTLYGKNLFDRHYASSAFSRYIFAIAFVPLAKDAIQPDPGRLFGAELRVKF